MPTFWILFWIAFYLAPLLWFASRAAKSEGYATSGSHIWVDPRTKTRVHDATERDVWRHRHPGKSWEKAQEWRAAGCLVVLLIGLLLGLALLAYQLLPLPEPRSERIAMQFGSPVLGLLVGGIYWVLLLSVLWEIRSPILRTLRWIALAAGPVLVAGFSVLALVKVDLEVPFSYHWIWLSPILVAALALLDLLIVKRKKDSAAKGGYRLGIWAARMQYEMIERRVTAVRRKGHNSMRDHMEALLGIINSGQLDALVSDGELFEESEGILLDLIAGRRMALPTDEIYESREEIIQAVQAFYFRGVRIEGREIHPRIQAALKK